MIDIRAFFTSSLHLAYLHHRQFDSIHRIKTIQPRPWNTPCIPTSTAKLPVSLPSSRAVPPTANPQTHPHQHASGKVSLGATDRPFSGTRSHGSLCVSALQLWLKLGKIENRGLVYNACGPGVLEKVFDNLRTWTGLDCIAGGLGVGSIYDNKDGLVGFRLGLLQRTSWRFEYSFDTALVLENITTTKYSTYGPDPVTTQHQKTGTTHRHNHELAGLPRRASLKHPLQRLHHHRATHHGRPLSRRDDDKMERNTRHDGDSSWVDVHDAVLHRR